jgi:signal transduction histidine kinase
LLADDGKNFNKEQCQSLQAVQDSLRYMVDIIESSIALRPMESTTSRSIVDLNGLARQAITLFQRVTQHAGVTLFAELPSAPTLVNVIPSHILIVFECILSNAIKYSEQGGQITVRIEKTSEGGVDAVHTIIKDTGKGMDREQLAHIFDRVRSGDKLAGLHLTSAGITLPLVREIIIAHGGKIWVESKPDKGSTFHFSLYASSQ